MEKHLLLSLHGKELDNNLNFKVTLHSSTIVHGERLSKNGNFK